jgi:hypothetical protein
MIPTLVYKSPGSQYGPDSTTYDWLGVKTQEDLDEKLAEGWHLTLADAISPPDNSPPTRSELEQKATELGLKFDGRTNDNKLGQRIQDAIDGMD